MANQARTARQKASPPFEQPFGGNRTEIRLNAAVMRAARGLWPRKTAHEIALRTGQTVRAAELQLAGSREIGGEALLKLLSCHEGYAFLAAVMDGLPARRRPGWWREIERARKRAGLRHRQKRLAADIAALEQDEQLDLALRFAAPGVVGPDETP